MIEECRFGCFHGLKCNGSMELSAMGCYPTSVLVVESSLVPGFEESHRPFLQTALWGKTPPLHGLHRAIT